MNILASTAAPTPRPPRYRIGRFALVTIDGTRYRWADTDRNGHTLAHVGDPDAREFFTHEEFAALLDGDSPRASVDQFHFVEARPLNEPRAAYHLADLPEWKARKAAFYGDLCDAFRAREADDPRLNLGDKCLGWLLPELGKAVERLWTEKKSRPGPGAASITLPSPRHFRRLYALYVELGYSRVALADRCRGGNRVSTVEPHDAEVRLRFAYRYASPLRPTKASVYRDLLAYIEAENPGRAAEGLPAYTPPARRTFEKIVDGLDPFWVEAKRRGAAAAQARFRMDGRGVEVERPLERGEMDDWEVHLQTLLAYARVWDTMTPEEQAAVRRTRLWMTCCVDVATKCILGLRFSAEPPSAATSLEALEMTLVDKTDIALAAGAESPWNQRGPFETLVTDNGAAFKAWQFRNAVSDIGTEHVFPPAGEAKLRPFIESVFRSLDRRFLSWFTGRTFSNFIEKGEYDAEATATVCADQLNAHLVRAVVDIYHNTPHAGLGGETPRNAWLRGSGKHGLLPCPSTEDRRKIFGIRLQRPIGDQGIRVFGLSYQSEEIQRIRKVVGKAEIECRVDRHDLWAISAKRPDGKWTTVPNRFGLPAGVSIWEWVAASRAIEEQHARNASVGRAVAVRAINALRESGDALAARAEFASATISDRHVAALERQLWRNVRLDEAEPAAMDGAELSPLAKGPEAIMQGIQLLPGVEGDLVGPDPSETPPASAAPREVTDQFGSADDISFDD
ncbi:hypothetical protein [Phyllobacterium phragmitis]|uniref:Integrase catalytic domain-containing protein n=1 Tax=Phyllobacterium phragmitis TaxID=2670329 RepID=A0ABQ0GZ10_9HYPH